ncbi:protein winged eye [Anopheles moucheti]|uniref:protein winged eye n=1 Tax=Anopheles moucheti TaxID=186751 RepID=UPI0022F0EFD4|nr:protein winged eye [Anopheles moucheti]
MLGSTANGRLMGPGVGSSTSSSSSSSSSSLSAAVALQQQSQHTPQQQQHPLAHHPYSALPSHHHHHHPLHPQHPALAAHHHHRSIWPSLGAATGRSAFELQTATNGEVTESLFAAGGYNTPPASSPFLPCSPLELVAKNFHSTTGAALSFSQANSSIFVQSQTDFINGTTAVAKKTETCIGRWEHGHIEPLQIQVPSNSFLPTGGTNTTTGSFALNSPESACSGERLPVGDLLHQSYRPLKADENGNHYDAFLRSYCIEREFHRHEQWRASLGPDGCKPKLHLPPIDDAKLHRREHSERSSTFETRFDSTALLSPTSPTTTPPYYEYGKLKRKLHSLLLETGHPVPVTASTVIDDRSPAGLLQTSHTPRQPASGPDQRHLEATPAPELTGAQQPATGERQQCETAAYNDAITTPTHSEPTTAPSSEAVNHRPRRRWAALHSAHAKANGHGNENRAPTPPPPRSGAAVVEAASHEPPGQQQSAALRAVQRLPKKRRSIRVDRIEDSATVHRDTDSKTVVHIKREPCQVSEVTTSNSFEATTNTTALNAIIKIEASSPKALTAAGSTNGTGSAPNFPSNNSAVARSNLLTSASAIISNVTVGGSGGTAVSSNIGTSGGGAASAGSSTVAATTMEQLGLASATNNSQHSAAHHQSGTVTTAASSASASIPVGIAVARQRLQESSATPAPQLHQGKELNRYGLGLAAAAAAAANGGSLNGTVGTTADLGCATPGLSQNMFFTGTNSTMIPLAPDAVTMGVTNAAVQNAVRTPPALWQYPAPVPMESMLPMPPIPPPVGFQLVRDPTTGQILFLPAAATIANPSNLLDKIYISCIEPFQQAVVWPSYPQSTASLQSPHLLLPQLPPQQLQPPPLAPLQMLSSDYLSTASTTLHQQHTQTHHSTRYLALTSESNGKRSSIASGKQSQTTGTGSSSSGPASTCGQPTIPLPIPASHTFIKIEDCSTSAGLHAAGSAHLATSLFGALNDVDKSNPSTVSAGNSLASGAGPHSHLALPATSDLTPHLLFQPANLIHIAPHHPAKAHSTGHTLLEASSSAGGTLTTSVANPTPPPSALPTTVTPALLSGLSQTANVSSAPPPLVATSVSATTCLTPPPDTTSTMHAQTDATDGAAVSVPDVIEPPEVQDANIQTDTPIMSEDESTQPPGGTDTETTITEAAAILSTEATLASAYQALASEQPLCHSTLINSSGDSAIEPDMSTSGLLNATNTSNCDQVDMELEPTNNKSAPPTPPGPVQNEPENLTVGATPSGGQQRRVPKLEVHSPTGQAPTVVGGTFSTSRSEKDPTGPARQQDHPVDLSGLELLSHSIEVFQKKSSLIKKEPISPQLPADPPLSLVPSVAATPAGPLCPEQLPQQSAGSCQLAPAMVPPTVPEAFLRADEPMGGLNLLCALAEQRFQEEGMFNKDSTATSSSSGSSNSSGSSYTSTSSSSSTASPPASPPNTCGKPITQQELLSAGISSHAATLATLNAAGAHGGMEANSRKRKHHKHSKDSNGKKSSKKSKHDKEQRRAEKRRKQNSAGGTSPDGEGDLDAELKESLTRVKAKLNRCSCKDGDEKDHRCCRTQWPSADELFSVIESDMKERLERITRQCEEKKRELEQMSTATVAKVKPLANNSMVRIPEMGKTFFGGFGSVTTAGGMLNTFGSGSGVPGSVLGHGLGGPKFSTIPALSPNFSSSSNSTTFVELPKLSSDTDSSGKREDDDACSMERLSYSKRKGGIPKKHDELTLTETIVAKKPKSLVGYILASKNTRVTDSSVKDAAQHQKVEKQHHNHWSHVLHQSGTNGAAVGLGLPKQHQHQQQQHHISESKFKKSPIHSSKFESTTSDDTSNLSDSSLKPQVKIRSPAGGVFAFEDENSKPSDASFSIFGGKPSIFDKVKTNATVGHHHHHHHHHQVGSLVGLKVSPVKAAVVTPLMKPQHHLVGTGGAATNGSLVGGPTMKRKKSRSKDRKRRSSEKKRIDQRCLLTSEHLGKDKTRVLTAMGGLFYAGCLSAVQPPDIYAVTLDGERGNRPHIMSREEVLRDAILEVAPKSVDDIIPGTRLCAYWSQQYRCLYPGVAAEPASPDPEKRFVNVEFDDGDNGKIALEDIRFLMSDYPIVEYDPNPLLSLGKRKRQPSHSEPCPQIGTLGPASSLVSHGTTSQPVSHAQPSATPLTATVTPMISSSSPLAGASTINSFALTTERAEKRLHDEAYREERRRLKKIRKDKLRRLAANNAELQAAGGGGGGGGGPVHKHKKSKSKCYDEFCKHRKHKKRRKHKKHHREAVPSSPEGTAADATGSMDDDISQGDSASQTAGSVQREGNAPAAEKEDTLTEEEVSSSVTESSGSYYQPQKKTAATERKPSTEQNGSKIAAFLPARQLWAWCGKGYRRSAGRVKKQFYKSIQRGKETISVGDSAVFLSTGRPDRPYIGHIESMWETSTNNMVVRVKWFYHPEETRDCPNLKYPGALFQSPHEDENDVQTISHKCEVLGLREYTAKFGAEPKQYTSIYDNNDTYYLAGYYDPTVMTIKMQPEIEILPPNERWVTTATGTTAMATATTTAAASTKAATAPTATAGLPVKSNASISISSNGNTKASNNTVPGPSVVSA